MLITRQRDSSRMGRPKSGRRSNVKSHARRKALLATRALNQQTFAHATLSWCYCRGSFPHRYRTVCFVCRYPYAAGERADSRVNSREFATEKATHDAWRAGNGIAGRCSAPQAVEFDRRSLYDCFIADQPIYLVPQRLMPATIVEFDDRPLKVSPNVWFSWRDEPPTTIRANYPLPRQFFQRSGILWVADPPRGLQDPLLGRSVVSGEDCTPGLGATKHAAFRVTTGGYCVWRESWMPRTRAFRRKTTGGNKWCRAAPTIFGEIGFATVQGLIHPFHIGALRRYYRRLVQTGGMKLGDSSSPRRFVAHNESVATFFHRQLTGVVGAIAGRPVKPSYVYVSAYQSGADLPAHTDRAQCEYSITLLLDQTPEAVDQSSWPLHLNTSAGAVAIWQGIGDALLYRGRRLEHFRTPLPQGMSSTSMFFHYVDQDFSGPLVDRAKSRFTHEDLSRRLGRNAEPAGGPAAVRARPFRRRRAQNSEERAQPLSGIQIRSRQSRGRDLPKVSAPFA